LQQVGALAAVEHVVAGAARQRVVAGLSAQQIAARVAPEHIGAVFADQIHAGQRGQQVGGGQRGARLSRACRRGEAEGLHLVQFAVPDRQPVPIPKIQVEVEQAVVAEALRHSQCGIRHRRAEFDGVGALRVDDGVAPETGVEAIDCRCPRRPMQQVVAGAAGDAVVDVGAVEGIGLIGTRDVEAFGHQGVVAERAAVVEFDVVEGALPIHHVGRIEGREQHGIGGVAAHLEPEFALRPKAECEIVGLSLLIVAMNLPFIAMGARQFSIAFAVKSSAAIVLLAMMVHFLSFPPVTVDKLLIAVFGGFFLGAGIGFAIRGGAVIDGSEVLAVSVSRRSSLTVGDFIAVFNVVLFAGAALLFSIETAMYSMLTYLSASKTVDFILNGIEEYIGVMIVSDHAEEIRHRVTHDLQRGITVFKSEGGFGKSGVVQMEKKILFCAITRLEVTKLLNEIEKVDERAFVIQYPIKDTKGGMIKKRPLHD
jgi:uncharacterized membrane-anchored protein YitT (DUF2179 family)